MPSTTAVADPAQLVKLALSKIGDIATLPEVTTRIIPVVDDPKSTARDLHNIIKNDPALATKILKVVNSAFYGLPGQVSEIDRAIVLLGLSAVKNIAISASISRLFTGERISDHFSARDIWKHSVAVAVATRQFCCAIGQEAVRRGGVPGRPDPRPGPAHRAPGVPGSAGRGHSRSRPRAAGTFCEVETEIIGADHQTLGAALAAKWKFPRGLQIVLGYHHTIDNLSEEMRLLPTMVYAADVLCCHERIGFHLTGEGQPLDDTLLESIGLSQVEFENARAALPEQIQIAEAMLTG